MVKKSLDAGRWGGRSARSEIVRNPELVFGIVGPIGVDIDAVVDALSTTLRGQL